MSYLNVWIHLVWSTKNREKVLIHEIKNIIIDHIKNNALKKNIQIDCIDGYSDHLHCLIKLKPQQSICNIANLIKGESSFWINRNRITGSSFSWQNDYYATSVSFSAVNIVRNYISKQEEHHLRFSYEDELNNLI